MVGERNDALLKGFNNDSVVEELKTALHQSYEKFEAVANELAESENERGELHRMDEERRNGMEELKAEREELLGKVERLENRAGLLEDEKKSLLEDVRARMKSAEEDLFEEQRRRDEWVQKVRNGWEQEKKKAGELAKEIVLLKSQVERGAVEREEERVMREEMSGELEACRGKVADAEGRINGLLEINQKNETLLQIEANRKVSEGIPSSPQALPPNPTSPQLLAVKFADSVKKASPGPAATSMLTPGRFVNRGKDLRSEFSAFKSIESSTADMGISPMSSVKKASATTSPMSGVKAEEEATAAALEEARGEASRLKAELQSLGDRSSKWQQAAASLQSALDAAVVSRDAYSAKAREERREKEQLLDLHAREKEAVGAELKLAFEQARSNAEKVQIDAVDATVVMENNEKVSWGGEEARNKQQKANRVFARQVVEMLNEEIREEKKLGQRLRENLEVVGKQCAGLVEKVGTLEAGLHRERRGRELLEARLKEGEGERDWLQQSMKQLEEAKQLEVEVLQERVREVEAEAEVAVKEAELKAAERKGEVEVEVKVEEKVVFVEKEKIVYVEKEGGRLQDGASGAMITALKTELGERDTEVQKLRKRMKALNGGMGGDDNVAKWRREREKENGRNGRSGRSGRSWGDDDEEEEVEEWKTIEPRKPRRMGLGGFRHEAREDPQDLMKENVERAKKLERAFGDLSKRLTQD
jgi:hypothetical protein